MAKKKFNYLLMDIYSPDAKNWLKGNIFPDEGFTDEGKMYKYTPITLDFVYYFRR